MSKRKLRSPLSQPWQVVRPGGPHTLWRWIPAALAVGFAVWAVALSVSAVRLRERLARDSGLVSELMALEQVFNELRERFPRLERIGEQGPAQDQWRHSYTVFSEQAARLAGAEQPRTPLRLALDKARRSVARMDELRVGLLRLPAKEARDLEAESWEQQAKAVEALDAALRAIWLRVRVTALELAAKDRQLNAVVAISCALAFLVVSLLLVHERVFRQRALAEAALDESMRRYESLVTSIDGIVWEADARMFQFVYVSPQAQRILGYPVDQWLEEIDFWAHHIHSDDRPQTVADCLSATKERKNHQLEYRMMTADGRALWLRGIVTVIVENGGPVKLRGVMLDVSDRRRTEEELRESEERFRRLFEDLPVACHEIDKAGVIRRVNRAECALLGVEPTELLGNPVFGFVAPQNRHEAEEAVRKKVSGTVPLVPFEREYVRGDGTRLIIEIHENLIRDKGVQVIGVRSVLLDVTDRKLAEEARRASDERYRELFENATDIVFTLDVSGNFTSLNKAGQRALGYTEEAALGKNFFQTLLAADAYLAEQMGVRKLAGMPAATRYEIEVLAKDGRCVPVEVSTRLIYSDGKPVGVQGIARDVTERKAFESELYKKNAELQDQTRRAEEASHLKSRFLANMSHELRTPLNAIIGFSELMHDGKTGPITADQKEFLGDVLVSAKHLLQLINDVLDLARIEAGRMSFRPEPVDLRRLVGEVGGVIVPLATNKRLHVQSEIDNAVVHVVVDPSRLKQVLYNYVSNALKFTPEGGSVFVRVRPAGPDAFRLEVEDTGIGIKPEDMSRLFGEFQQLDGELGKRYAGTGLGLALTKRIVEAQGGTVGVESTPGKGSVFYAVLPRVTRPSGDEGTEENPLARSVLFGRPAAVLVIEDDPAEAAILAQTLRQAGYSVAVARNGAEALTQCQQQVFMAITLDLLLPDMSGWDVVRAVRAAGLNTETPVIVVRNVTQPGTPPPLKVHGHLTKPVAAEALLHSLRQAVHGAEDLKGAIAETK